jgi:HSP20 family protein
MAQTQTSQNETSVRKGSLEGNGGAQSRQDRDVVTQESTGRKDRAMTRAGSRQLTSAAQRPFATIRELSREMDRLMDSFFGRGFGSFLRDSSIRDDEWQGSTLWTPQIDVQHRDNAIVVRADLPGVRKEDVQVEVQDDALIISGERREEHEEGGDDQSYRMYERSYGSFYRSVPLPTGTKSDEIQAVMRDGVLKVTLPLPENARPKKIQIQS